MWWWKGCVWKWNQQHLLMWRDREEELRMTPRLWQEGEGARWYILVRWGRIGAKQILKGQIKPQCDALSHHQKEKGKKM